MHINRRYLIMGHELAREQIHKFTADKPLHRAIIAGQYEKVKEILSSEPGIVNSSCRVGGWTFTTFELALICHEDDKAAEFIKLFLTYKPQLNYPGNNGDTELWHAIVAERIKCIELLLKAGSDPNHKIQNPFALDKDTYAPFMLSVFMEMFFQDDSKITATHIRIFKLLIEYGLDPSVISPTYMQFSLLHRLLMLDSCTSEVFSIFLEAKHKINIDLKTQSKNKDINHFDGESLLHWAVRTKKPDCIQLLLNKGANPNILNGKGLTPLDVCLLSDPFALEIKKILLAKGAIPSPMKEVFIDFEALMPTVVEMGSVKLPPADIFSQVYENKQFENKQFENMLYENKQNDEFEQFKQAVDDCYKDREIIDLPALDKKKYLEVQTASTQNKLHLHGRSMKAFLSTRKQSCAYSELPKERLVNITKRSQLSLQYLRKQKLSWDLLYHFSSEKYFRDTKAYPRIQIEVLGKKLTVIDCREKDHRFVVHTTKTDSEILRYVLKTRAHFLNEEPYISCSVADKTTPPAEMSHQGNVSFPLQLLFQMPVGRLQFASHMDVGSGIGIFSNEIHFLDARNKTSMKLNWLQSEYQMKSVSRNPLGYLPLPPYLLQPELEVDPRYKQCFSGEATGYFSDDLMDTEFLSIDSLQRKTKNHYNEILVGLGTREEIEEPKVTFKIVKKGDMTVDRKVDNSVNKRVEKKEERAVQVTHQATQSSGLLSWLYCCTPSKPKRVPPKIVNKEDVNLLGLGIEEAWLNKFKNELAPKLDRNQSKSIIQSLKVMKDSGLPIFLYRTEFERQAEKVGYRDRAKQFLNRYVELRIRHFRYSKMAEKAEMAANADNKMAQELQQQIQAMEKEIMEFDHQYLFEYFNYTPQMDVAVETAVKSVLRELLNETPIEASKEMLREALKELPKKIPKETPTAIIMSYYRPHVSFKNLAAREAEKLSSKKI